MIADPDQPNQMIDYLRILTVMQIVADRAINDVLGIDIISYLTGCHEVMINHFPISGLNWFYTLQWRADYFTNLLGTLPMVIVRRIQHEQNIRRANIDLSLALRQGYGW